MTNEALGEAELAEAVAAIRGGTATIGGGPSDQGWVVRAVGGRLVHRSWFQHDDGRLDEVEREIDEAALRGLLRRYGRKVIRRA